MKKIIIFSLVIFIIGIGIGYIYLNFTEEKKEVGEVNNYTNTEVVEKNNTIDNTLTTVSEEMKISPNAVLIINKNYRDCGHTITSVVEMPVDTVNLTEKEFQEEYKDWEIISFSPKEISIYKEFDGICNEHYIIRENNGYVIVNTIDENNKESLYEITDISTEYLTDGDKENLAIGIHASGLDDLNSKLEDYE